MHEIEIKRKKQRLLEITYKLLALEEKRKMLKEEEKDAIKEIREEWKAGGYSEEDLQNIVFSECE